MNIFERETTEKNIKEILREDYYVISLSDKDPIRLRETLNSQNNWCTSIVITGSFDTQNVLVADGRGPVDAWFKALTEHYSKMYASLTGINFKAYTSTAVGGGSDSQIKIHLTIENSYGEKIHFEKVNDSMVRGSVELVTEAVEYFINSEKTVLKLEECIKDARTRNRPNLVEKYTYMLASLMGVTSYQELLGEHHDKSKQI